LWISIVSFAAITLCVASQRVTPKVSVYFVIDSDRKLLNRPSYVFKKLSLVYNLGNTGWRTCLRTKLFEHRKETAANRRETHSEF
jgi:hypothetical protein